MAFIIIDGFDTYNGTDTLIGLRNKWASSGSNSAYSMADGRFDGQSVRLADGTGTNAAVQRQLASTITTFCIGWAMRVTSLSSGGVPANQPTLALKDSAAAYQISVAVNADGAIKLYRGDAAALLVASAAGVVLNDSWQYYELVGTIANSGATLDLYVDGALACTFTGDTQHTANTNVQYVELAAADGTGSVTVTYYDDFYMTDTAVRVGERRVKTIYPVADTAAADWAPATGADHYAMVNSATVDTTGFIAASTVGDADRFEMGDLGVTPITIDAVQVSAFAKKTDATARTLNLQLESGATEQDGSAVTLGTNYGRFERIQATNPDGGGAWNAASVNALKAGVKVAS